MCLLDTPPERPGSETVPGTRLVEGPLPPRPLLGAMAADHEVRAKGSLGADRVRRNQVARGGSISSATGQEPDGRHGREATALGRGDSVCSQGPEGSRRRDATVLSREQGILIDKLFV